MLTVGTVVCDDTGSSDKWTVLGFLGKGTCCEVYRVQSHTKPHMKAALKVYKEGLKYERAHDGEALLLDLVTRANGPCKYLVKIITDFDYGEQPCLVQELLDLDLRQLMAKVQCRGLSIFLMQKLTRDIFRGLCRLHKSGFVHADIKPTNLMWSPSEYCMKIIDFSLSYHIQDDNISLLQSQGYRAPETEYWNACCSKQCEVTAATEAGSCLITDQPIIAPDVIDPGGGARCSPGTAQSSQNLLQMEPSTAPISTGESNTAATSMDSAQPRVSGLGESLDVCPTADGGKDLARTLLRDADLVSEFSDQCRTPSRAADIWSVGCVMLEMFHGTKVFTANKLAMLQFSQCKGLSLQDCIIQTVDDVIKESSRAHTTQDLMLLKQFIIRCLTVNASQRWSADEALQHKLLTEIYIPSFEDLCVLHSPIIRLLNVMENDDLADSEKYQDVVLDIREECQKYGDVVTCVIPRSGDGAGKVYVEYGCWQQAEVAYSKLCHRIYNHHNVIVTYFSVDDFRAGIYF